MSGDDLLTALAERLSMTLAWQATALEQINRTEWETIARAALAFVAGRLPTREEIHATINAHAEYSSWAAFVEHVTDALLRDLRERLGVKDG